MDILLTSTYSYVHNKCICSVIGALKFSPILAVCAETSLTPLQFRRTTLQKDFWPKLCNKRLLLLTENIRFLNFHSKFSREELPLLYEMARDILKIQKFALQFPSYRLASFPCFLKYFKNTILQVSESWKLCRISSILILQSTAYPKKHSFSQMVPKIIEQLESPLDSHHLILFPLLTSHLRAERLVILEFLEHI